LEGEGLAKTIMERRMTQDEALNWIAQIFDEAPGKLTPETPREAIPAWDSLGALVLMSSLDSDFGIVLTDEQLQETRKAGDILAILQKSDVIVTVQ